MKLRQRIEKYWGVWIFNDRRGYWEPFEEGYTTRKAAERYMRQDQKAYPDERFAIVHTTSVRVLAKDTGAK